MLEVKDIHSCYGKVQVLWGVSLKVNEGEIVALIGANGAGKTTLLNTISGMLPPASGSVTFLGTRVDGLEPRHIVEMGISYVPQGGRLFPDMTVRENLEMGAYPERAWKQKEDMLKKVYQLFPRLEEREQQLARTLSGGEKQMLAMARCLMARPKLCVIDEMSYGLAPLFVLEVFRIIKSLRDQGITVLLIEQNVQHTLEIADRAYVLENGRVVLEGTSAELLQSDYVREAYLGL
ncbi:MAG: ABC transporter ATP-binding protein [Peptococcaceae bacterium]|nr:ABC transporter ATP-binding protein [Peptococcaceae bacterium]